MKNLNFKLIGRRITVFLLMCFTFLFIDIGCMHAQNVITTEGQILDKNTSGLMIGATVQEKGKSNGIITGVNGSSSIKVKQNAIFDISSVGCETFRKSEERDPAKSLTY
jgi:hypothetical protein